MKLRPCAEVDVEVEVSSCSSAFLQILFCQKSRDGSANGDGGGTRPESSSNGH